MNLRFFTSLKCWQIILILFMLALSLRVARCFIVDRISKDGVLYVRMAKGVSGEDKTQAFIENRRMPPLYILLIAGVNRVGISFESAARMISVIAGALLIIPFFLVVRLFFGDKAAVISGLLIAVHPSLVRISSTIMRDSLFLSLLVFSFAFVAFAIQKKRYLYWGIGGLFAALASATRAEGFELLIAVLLWMIIDLILRKKMLNSQKSLALIKDETNLPVSGEGGAKTVTENRGGWTQVVAGPIIFILLFFTVSYPISESVKGTASTWGVVDKRIIGYTKSLLFNSSEEALHREDTL